MDFRWMAAACAAMIVGGASAQNAVQWRVEDGGNGHWYASLRLPKQPEWLPAKSAAEARGAHLATLTSAGENQFVFQVAVVQGAFAGINGPYLGGRKNAGGSFEWITGEPFAFTSWRPGEPSSGNWEPYLNFLGVDGAPAPLWNDIDSPETEWSMIEWSADCNGDGIVDYGQIRDGSLPDFNGNNIPDCCEQGAPCIVGSYPVQWRVEDGGNGHWYQMRDFGTLSWILHRDAAVAVGGHLAAITSAAENAHIERLIPQTIPGYGQNYIFGPTIGLFQSPGATEPDGGWTWVTGEAFGFTDWFPTEPNNFPNGENWVRFRFQGGTLAWNDVFESMTPGDLCCNPFVTRAIVEWSADCNGDGIVDYGQIPTGQLADTNANGIPDTCEVDPCPGDVTGNGVVNGTDLAAILAAWGSDGSNKFDCDIDNDGIVGGSDLAFVLVGWGACP
jgi:hypothetical protein